MQEPLLSIVYLILDEHVVMFDILVVVHYDMYANDPKNSVIMMGKKPVKTILNQ